MSLEPQLRAGIDELGLSLDDKQIGQLLQYQALLGKWGKVYNLTAVRDAAEMLTHHLLDSLAVVAPLRRQTGSGPVRLLDVGSGAGLPGVVVAICCPEIRVDCLDAVAKKAAFVQQAAGTLQLPNLRGVHGRVEQVRDAYDVVSSRAFASLVDFVAGSREALDPSGIWMAMKGRHPQAEIAALPADVFVFHVEQLRVPGLDAERCIVWMRPAAPDR
ncbi:16S rRNA (guanine(527)-N(7))-methyltransferase RsmG [Ramlibacter sp. MMS24-I3-19]|uniref:16S rRNA (guanine(527)-N(7))-methyltransferase RsmG n=1 Tax=Ramlibacter sp. MMS24-I3-19 TaxID=3416606 RepID=UPI003CFC70D4